MIGLVVVNYNDYQNTINFINSICHYSIIDKIVIVDNASTNHSYNHLKKIVNEKIFLLKNESNKGYGSGINLGAKYLIKNFKVDYIIVSNTDIIIEKEEDISELIKYMKQDIALIGPTILEQGQKNRGWKIPSCFDDILLNLPIIHRNLRKKLLFYNDNHYESDYSYVETVSGCFFIINAKILKIIDFFDENIFLYYEENVIGYKLKEKGYKVAIANNITVTHNHSVTIDNNLGRIRKYKALKKSQFYFHKHYTKSSFLGMSFLWITNKFMLLCLYLVYFIKKIANCCKK